MYRWLFVYIFHFRNKEQHCKICYKEGALNPTGLVATMLATSQPTEGILIFLQRKAKGKGTKS